MSCGIPRDDIARERADGEGKVCSDGISSRVALQCLFRSLMASSSTQPQQVAVTDLDLPQLSDVRRQLEEVRIFISC
jgi:hypothetical protein